MTRRSWPTRVGAAITVVLLMLLGVLAAYYWTPWQFVVALFLGMIFFKLDDIRKHLGNIE